MIGIRVDANEIVATGHMMRCLTIAEQLLKLGEEVIFFLADEYGISLLEEKKMSYEVLHTDWENPIEEIPVLSDRVLKKDIRVILFDSYRMTREYFTILKKQLQKVKFAYIDDLFEEIYPIEAIINYNAYYVQFPYEKMYDKEGAYTKLCLGPSYTPLRKEFGKTDIKEGVNNTVLLSCGGGDRLQALLGILERIVTDVRFSETVFHVVVGLYHQKKEDLENFAKLHPHIILHHNVSNMAQLMEENSVAVSAAGTMLYELCAMERPTVFFITADNQRYDSDFFAKEERMIFAGDMRTDRENCIDRIVNGIDLLLKDRQGCLHMKEKLRQVTDGKGAERIAKMLKEL